MRTSAVSAAATGGGAVSAPCGRTPPEPAAVWRRSRGGADLPRDAVDPDALHRLAAPLGGRSGADARRARGGTRARLATILRRLACVLRAEPFAPDAAQELGVALVEAGLRSAPSADAADVLGTSLRLLRTAAPAALGVPGAEGTRRLQAALDQLAAGFVAGLTRALGPVSPTVPVAFAGGSARCRRPRLSRVRARVRRRRRVRSSRRRAGAPAAGAAGPPPDPGATDLRLTMIEHAPVGVAVMALDGRVLAANPALSEFLDLGDLLDEPRPFTDFVHTDDLPEVLGALDAAAARRARHPAHGRPHRAAGRA